MARPFSATQLGSSYGFQLNLGVARMGSYEAPRQCYDFHSSTLNSVLAMSLIFLVHIEKIVEPGGICIQEISVHQGTTTFLAITTPDQNLDFQY